MVLLQKLSVACLLLLMAACGTLPERKPLGGDAAEALPPRAGDRLAVLAGEAQVSGFVPLVSGADAYDARVALIGLAERSLDIQYYMWADDLTARALLLEVLAAADRGVRVRLLLDDMHTGLQLPFAVVDRHPRIEVRVFNPFGWRKARLMEWFVEGVRLNRRMHNKVVIADNALAITGGRNIADHYFAADVRSNFRDFDLLATGPIVRAMSVSFDDYWQSRWSYPIAWLDEAPAEATPAALAADLEAWIAEKPPFPFMRKPARQDLTARLQGFLDRQFVAPAVLLYDSPDKVAGLGNPGVAAYIFDSARDVEREFLMEISYLIPGDEGVAMLAERVQAGVRVAALTNSLATNDITPAHSGYANYREALLRAGLEIHELRPDAVAEQRHHTFLASHSFSHLHTKAFVYDRKRVLIGSMNVDPRSVRHNTELGILVESPELAAHVAGLIEEGMHPLNSYALELRDGRLRWRVSAAGEEEWIGHEPDTGWWERFTARVFALLPIEGLL